MPHYKDGTEANPGDIVKGKGYNIKDANGDLAEIVGIISTVTPGADSCNVSLLIPDGVLGTVGSALIGSKSPTYIVSGRMEYGQADHFEKVG